MIVSYIKSKTIIKIIKSDGTMAKTTPRMGKSPEFILTRFSTAQQQLKIAYGRSWTNGTKKKVLDSSLPTGRSRQPSFERLMTSCLG